jgi:ADP-ribose pyrophosphatase
MEKSSPFKGRFRVDEYRLKHRLFEGGWSPEMTREVFERGHAVVVLLFDPDLDRVVMIEQFRPGAYAALASEWFDDGASPWLVECVAGIIEKGENPEEVARRETIEETGCEVREIEPICHYLVSPGGSSESAFVFCGRVDATSAEGIHGITDEHENIRVFSLPTGEALKLLDEGQIINAMTIITLQWLRENHVRLLNEWGVKRA